MTFTGYIYKLTGACGKVYIGSTADYDSRLICHKSKSNSTNSRLLLKPIVDEIIDTREYILTKTLRLVEQFYLDNINNINSQRAYTNKNKAYIKYYKKTYKKYYEENIEKIKEYQKKYYEENREKSRESNKKHYQENRETRLKKVKCECGCVVSKDNLLRHKKSKKHQKLIRIIKI